MAFQTPLFLYSCVMTQRTASGATLSPELARILDTVPATSDGISMLTLSVVTSSNGSLTSTLSPTDFNQLVINPSVTESPNCGRRNSTSLISSLFSLRVSSFNNSNRASRQAYQVACLIFNSNFPHLCTPPAMNRFTGGFDHARADRLDVVGVDLEPNRCLAAEIDVEAGAETCSRFSECDRCTTMEQTERLMGAVIHRHGDHDAFRVRLDNGHAEHLTQRIFQHFRQLIQSAYPQQPKLTIQAVFIVQDESLIIKPYQKPCVPRRRVHDSDNSPGR